MLAGLVNGAGIWVWGVLIAAYGQLLRAQLDTAVHTSTLLTDEDKAHVLTAPTRP